MKLNEEKLKWIIADAKEELNVDDEGLKKLLKDYVSGSKKQTTDESFGEFLRK